MALNIKSPETERLARELARRRRQGITEVVTEALRKELARERNGKRQDDTAARLRRIDEIIKRYQGRRRDIRPTAEIVGYNEHGLFD